MRGLEILDPISVGHDMGLIRCETDPGMSLPGSRDHPSANKRTVPEPQRPIRGQTGHSLSWTGHSLE